MRLPEGLPAPSSILICRPNGRLGNTVLLTPLIEQIETKFPGAEVHILTAFPAAPEIFREFSCVRTLWQLPRLGTRHPLRHVAVLLRARAFRYDLIIDPCPKSWSSRFAMRVLRGRTKVGFSGAHKKSGAHISIPFAEAPTHMGAYPVYLFRRAVMAQAAEHTEGPVPPLSIRLTEAELHWGRRKMRQLVRGPIPERIITVATCASGAKQLPVEWWREMLASLCERLPNIRIVEIVPASGEARLPEHVGYFSTSLRRVAAVISASDSFVSADSGLMHLGSATPTTTFGLFNATDPLVYAPYGRSNAGIHIDPNAPSLVASQIERRLAWERPVPSHA